MDNRQFISDYTETFGKAALPVAFWHSDCPVAEPEEVGGCFFPVFRKVREGHAVSFDSQTMKCGGGKFYCGLAPMPDYVPSFVSEKERYKASAGLVADFVEGLDIRVSERRYINFQRLDQTGEDIDYHGVLIFATPDVLSGLVAWASYDNSSEQSVRVLWGSGCSATIRAAIRENDRKGESCFIGLFDPSVRPRVEACELGFAIPKCRLERMAGFIRDTCLFNGMAWRKVRERINE